MPLLNELLPFDQRELVLQPFNAASVCRRILRAIYNSGLFLWNWWASFKALLATCWSHRIACKRQLGIKELWQKASQTRTQTCFFLTKFKFGKYFATKVSLGVRREASHRLEDAKTWKWVMKEIATMGSFFHPPPMANDNNHLTSAVASTYAFMPMKTNTAEECFHFVMFNGVCKTSSN